MQQFMFLPLQELCLFSVCFTDWSKPIVLKRLHSHTFLVVVVASIHLNKPIVYKRICRLKEKSFSLWKISVNPLRHIQLRM